MFLEPCVLRGNHVCLRPLEESDLDALEAVALDPSLWTWTTTRLADRADLERYIAEALRARAEGTALPFVLTDPRSGQLMGGTRYANAEPAHRRVEIGWTFVAPAWQRTPVNTEAKYLLLQHAFGVLGCVRVELKADALNTRSRTAILRVGAREEGTLRSHMIVWDGRVRDTVYFSILASEWPGVKEHLERKLNR